MFRCDIGSYILIWLLLTAAISWAETCYRPAGNAADVRYAPCYNNTGQASMCCRINDNDYPDICRNDGLCNATYQSDVIWRESCTDQTWQSPQCLRLCIDGSGYGNDNMVTSCSDGSFCCGYENNTCCSAGQGVRISNGQVVTSSALPATYTTPSVNSIGTSVPALVLEPISTGPPTALPPHSTFPSYSGQGTLLQGYCVTPDFVLIDGPTAYWAPVVGCVSDKTDCCPYPVSQTTAMTVTIVMTTTVNIGPGGVTQIPYTGIQAYPIPASNNEATLERCPDDYQTVSSGCCPSGYKLWDAQFGGQIPCYSSLSSYLVPPAVPVTSYSQESPPAITGTVSSSGLASSTHKPTSAVVNIVFAVQFPVQPSSGLSTGGKAGIGTGAGVAGIAIIALSLLLIWRTRKHKKAKQALASMQQTTPTSSPYGYSTRPELHAYSPTQSAQTPGSYMPQDQNGFFLQQQMQQVPPTQGYYGQQPMR